MLKLIKKGDKYWLFEASEIGLFSPSKFTINLELNEIVIVYENGLKSKRYNVSDCEIYDLGELTPFTTSNGDLFMQKLEELNCPCFQKNENIFNISGGAWGDITGDLSNQTDLQTALDSKLDKVSTAGVERAYIINADGSQSTKATSDFKDVLEFTDFDAFPTTGESGKIYIALDTNFTYRWGGSVYVQIGGINQDLYPIKYWYQATGAGILQTYGTNAIFAIGTQSDIVGVVSYRKYLTTTALGNIAFVRESSFARIISNRGFHYEMRFKLENTASASDWRGLFGFRTTSAPTNVNPTDDTQPFLGIGADSGDTNLFLISKLMWLPIVKVDTGIPKSTTDVLHLEIKRLNGTNTNELTLKNLSTGDMVTTVFDNINITTITNYVSNNTSAQAIGFSIQRIRLNISE